MNIDSRNKIITVILGVIILGLAYWLYDSLVTPYQEVREQEAQKEQVRQRMLDVKDALIQYQTRNETFPPTDGGLDSLVNFLKTDSMMVAMGDTLFGATFNRYNPDSLVYSPKPPHNRFEYTLNDTLRPQIYLLEDPDSDDVIGSLERTTLRNAPNWN